MTSTVALPWWKKILTHQWSFFWAGVGFGVAQIIFMIANYVQAAGLEKALVSQPLGVTTYLGRMFHNMEVFWLGVEKGAGLFGPAFSTVDSWGPILGMILGGFLVAMAERESRSWVKYSPGLLLMSFLGGMIFSYGTRLAGGCTLHHLLGGTPLMSIKSTAILVAMSVGGMLAFFLMAKLGLAKYFKHQETKAYVSAMAGARAESDGVTYDPSYRPGRDPWRWVALSFLALFLVPSIYYFFSPQAPHSVVNAGVVFMGLTLLAGIVGGFAMGKAGFGTECALVAVEAGPMIQKDEQRFQQMGVPIVTRSLMKGLLPLHGVLAAMVITSAFAVTAWLLFGVPLGYQQSPAKDMLNWSGVIGGLLLGAGAVFLIGCEIRTYMRLGLGYTNALIGFIGFAVGYVPFSLYYDAHVKFAAETLIITDTYTWAQWFFPGDLVMQKVFALLWVVMLLGLLVWTMKIGVRRLNAARAAQLMNRNTEEVETEVKGTGTFLPLPARG